MEWFDIPEIEGCQANKIGQIRNLNYKHKGITKILRQSKNEKGYLRVNINGKLYRTHRLIARTFLKDYDEKLEVNHKNGIKDDNRTENLEMVTAKYNTWHRHYILNKMIIPVEKIDKTTGELIKRYPSISEAERQTGIYHSSISNVCKGRKATAGGYVWRYSN